MSDLPTMEAFDHLGPEVVRDESAPAQVGDILTREQMQGQLGTWVGHSKDGQGNTLYILEALPSE